MGRTPVYIAARHNVRVATMRVLIRAGGDINVRDNVSCIIARSRDRNNTELTI